MINKLSILMIFLCFMQSTIYSQVTSSYFSQFKSEGKVWINNLTYDKDNNYYCLGTLEKDIELISKIPDSIIAIKPYGDDIFISKFNAQNRLLWTKQIIGSNDEFASELCIDSNGDLIITGSFRIDTDFDPSENEYILEASNWWEPFILKLDSDGNFKWAKKFDGEGIAFSVDTDSNDNILVSGWFKNTTDFNPDGKEYILESLGQDAFVAKLDVDGKLLWAKQYGGKEWDVSFSLKTDKSNNVVLTGWFRDTLATKINNQDVIFQSKGGNDVFILKLNENGNEQWLKNIGSTSDDNGTSINIDNEENIYLSISLGDGTAVSSNLTSLNYTNTSDNQILFLKLDNSGNVIWSNSIENELILKCEEITVDTADNVFAVGWFNGKMNLEIDNVEYQLDPENSTDGFLLKINEDGDIKWIEQLNSDSILIPSTVHINTDSEILTGGNFKNNIDFFGNNNIALNDYDSYIIKLIESSTGITQIDIPKAVIYPNPASDFINVDYFQPILKLDLINNLGQKFSLQKDGASYDVSKLHPGIYYCLINDNVLSQMVIVINYR